MHIFSSEFWPCLNNLVFSMNLVSSLSMHASILTFVICNLLNIQILFYHLFPFLNSYTATVVCIHMVQNPEAEE